MIVRDATLEDVPALAAMRGSAALHRDRVRDADGVALRYLLAEEEGVLLAFACIVLAQPAAWPPVDPLPQVVDLTVRAERRGEGVGGAFLRALEGAAREAGHACLYVAVEPEANPRALRFYERLGYEALDERPRRDAWAFTDSDGVRHAGVEWTIRLRRALS